MKTSTTKEIEFVDSAQLLSLPLVAKFLGVCSRTILRWVARTWCVGQTHCSKTSNKYLTAIQAFRNWCHKSERLPRNPLEAVGWIEKATDSKYQRRALTDAECSKLIRMRRAVVFAVSVGH